MWLLNGEALSRSKLSGEEHADCAIFICLIQKTSPA